jgi:hypothetical protein
MKEASIYMARNNRYVSDVDASGNGPKLHPDVRKGF